MKHKHDTTQQTQVQFLSPNKHVITRVEMRIFSNLDTMRPN